MSYSAYDSIQGVWHSVLFQTSVSYASSLLYPLGGKYNSDSSIAEMRAKMSYNVYDVNFGCLALSIISCLQTDLGCWHSVLFCAFVPNALSLLSPMQPAMVESFAPTRTRSKCMPKGVRVDMKFVRGVTS